MRGGAAPGAACEQHQVTSSQGLQLLAGAVANVTAVFGPGACNTGKLEDAIDELSELCWRHKRAWEGDRLVQRALLPADLYEQIVRC
ncbi:hypothetical protein WJX72_004153 [[Myrmecia] bisecta]|uniref:Uncharacterized protein n=1 Tax=[Myrmecia] bisecta TaxID=41462 RepID=A0AAW1PLF9_9CHLO